VLKMTVAATQKEQALEQRFQAMFTKAQLKNMGIVSIILKIFFV
jgi:hypothetical protein